MSIFDYFDKFQKHSVKSTAQFDRFPYDFFMKVRHKIIVYRILLPSQRGVDVRTKIK